ncbi:hypothetical protein SAMN04489806_0294 [Paramicrobacterium humi]|uniref:DUF2087 domain-containing protein n=1 Tax=Paramicrobacterium humi TaxID=640635 RepID=A0A1H4IV05_9MICO|nr:DUF2087 domain-containing protein [Microbacterium humi]SEB37827.1 hypothetical protein SAMN04489806_0294 [Microbacterium humi]
MTEESSISWRAVVAALANAEARRAYAHVVLGHDVADAPPKSVRQLERAGLIVADGDRFIADGSALRTLLRETAEESPQAGPERYLRRDGRVDRYPSKPDDRVELLGFIAAHVIAPDERLAEPELNERLLRFDEDTARLRRHLVDYGVLSRTPSGSEYALSPAGEFSPH